MLRVENNLNDLPHVTVSRKFKNYFICKLTAEQLLEGVNGVNVNRLATNG